ncbi:MAG: hypothetical protein U1D30_06465 [Planctomycetota bacterium]
MLFLLALTIRGMAFYLLSSTNTGVESAHHEHASIAKSLAQGRGFRFNFFGQIDAPSLTSIEAPLVPGLLAGCYYLFGIESPRATRAMLFVQIAVSAWTVVLLWWLAESVTGSKRAAWVTGLLATFYPPLIVSGLHIQAVGWNLFWLSLVLLSAVKFTQTRSSIHAGFFALAGVGGLLTDPILGLVLVLLLAYLRFWSSSNRIGWRMTACIAGLILLGISPWLARNALVHGRFVFIKDSFYYVLWQGNNEVSQGTDKLLVVEEAASQLRSAWNPLAANNTAAAIRRQAVSVNSCMSPAFIAELQGLPGEIERMDRFKPLALQAVFGHPGRYLGLCIQRLGYWLWFDETNPRSHLWHYRLSYIALLGLVTMTGLLARRLQVKMSAIVLAVLGLSRARAGYHLRPFFAYRLKCSCFCRPPASARFTH